MATIPTARLKDIPALARDNSNLAAVMDAIREAMQTFRGYRGDPLDQALTLRTALDKGVLLNSALNGYGRGPLVGPGSPDWPITSLEVDLTPPPTPMGLTATAGLTYLYINCDVPVYTQGHGHDRTVVYGAQWPTTEPTAPTFSAAVELFTFQGTIGAYPTTLGTRWCIWIKWKSNDGVLSTSPAGGTNGVTASTGKIGNADLLPLIIEAGNLAAGAVDATKFVSTIEPVTLVPNGALPTVKSTSTIFYAPDSKLYRWSGTAYVATVAATDMTGAITATQITDGAISTPKLAAGAITTAKLAAGAVTANEIAANTITAGEIATGAITAGKIATNAIAVGSAAIQNGAIVNAMIGDATIDNAKIANLSASKLTIGDGTVGGNLKSTTFTSGSAGWLLQPNGNVEFNNAVVRGTVYAAAGTFSGDISAATGNFRGQITGGSYAGYAWPASGGTGFYLGPNGLLLGNANDGKYLQVEANGNIYTPGFTSINGAAWFSGSGSFSGAVYASSGTFAGALSAATGTFSGSLSAAGGTFAGTLTAGAVNAVNTINIANNAVSATASGAGGQSASTNMFIPYGQVMRIVAVATGYNTSGLTLYINGSAVASGTTPLVTTVYEHGDASPTYSYSYAPITLTGRLDIYGYDSNITISAVANESNASTVVVAFGGMR